MTDSTISAVGLEKLLSTLLSIRSSIGEFQRDFVASLSDSPFYEISEACKLTVSWVEAYELPFGLHVRALYELAGLGAYARRMTPQNSHVVSLELLADSAAPDFYEHMEDHTVYELAAMLSLLVSCTYSLECFSIHSVSLNRLVELVRGGSDKAFFDAVAIDPSAVSSPTMARRLNFALLYRDDVFLSAYRRALDGPRQDRLPYQSLRIVHQVIEEVGAFRKLSRREIHEVVVDRLRLYGSPHGDTLKGLFSRFDDWRKESTR